MDVEDVNESSGAAAEPVAGDDVVMVLGEEEAGPDSGIPFASTIGEFLADPEAFRPRPSFFREYIEDETILTHAIKIPHPVAVQKLLLHGADPNQPSKKGVTPISAASYKGHIAIMQMLIEKGANVNTLNLSGSTALIQASHFGHSEAVTLLLDHNADADFANAKGTTALMRASQEGHVEISKLLIAARADVNRKNHEGMNALMLASQRGHADMVVLLVKAGASMDEQTSQGSTALMLACKRGHEKCVSELVGMGAEIHMLDGRDRSARDTALKRQHTNLVYWLSTQVQIRIIQESRRTVRTAVLLDMRAAFLAGRLRFTGHEQPALLLYDEAKRLVREQRAAAAPVTVFSTSRRPPLFTGQGSQSSAPPLTHPAQAAVARGLSWPLGSVGSSGGALVTGSLAAAAAGAKMNVAALSPGTLAAFETILALTSQQPPSSSSSIGEPGDSPPGVLTPRPGQADWLWPYLLFRVMGMPEGIFELIIDFLPSPRIWQWSLYRLRKRCAIAPHVAVTDASAIIDEIFTDANVFPGADQKFHLVKISHSPAIQEYLVTKLQMPAGLVASLRTWADTQSILARTTEVDVSFKAPFARKFLQVAALLNKWYRQRSSSVKTLGLAHEVTGQDEDDAEGGEQTETAGEDNSIDNGFMDEDTDQDLHGEHDDNDDSGEDFP